MPGEGTLAAWNNPSGTDLWISNPYRGQKYPADLRDRPEDVLRVWSISQLLKPGHPGAPPATCVEQPPLGLRLICKSGQQCGKKKKKKGAQNKGCAAQSKSLVTAWKEGPDP